MRARLTLGVLFVALLAASALLACGLNPQPFPPGDMTGVWTDGGVFGDASREAGTSDAGGDVDVADASEAGTSDADAATQDASDARLD